MRLWHYKLIPVLPNKMLVSQWRECIAIKRQCYYNLQEKYDRGIISEDEWEKIWHKCNETVKELM